MIAPLATAFFMWVIVLAIAALIDTARGATAANRARRNVPRGD